MCVPLPSWFGKNAFPNVETQPDDCLNPYSATKIAGEKLCKMYTNLYGLETVVLRYFNVFGQRCPTRGQYAPVIGIFRRQLASENICVWIWDKLIIKLPELFKIEIKETSSTGCIYKGEVK